MRRFIDHAASSGIEFTGGEKRDVLVNGKIEHLPDDPKEIARIIRGRRAKRTPAQALRAKIDASLKRRVGH